MGRCGRAARAPDSFHNLEYRPLRSRFSSAGTDYVGKLSCAALMGACDQSIEYALNLGDVAANSQPEEIGFQAFDQDRVHALARRAGTL